MRRLGGSCGGVAAMLAVLLGLSACGTTLQDHPGSTAKSATAAAAPASPAAPASALAATPPATSTEYVVQRGDTLHALSRRTGVGVQQLASLNDLPPPYLLKVGQTVRLPNVGAPPSPGTTMVASVPSMPSGEHPPVAAPRAAVTEAALPSPTPAALPSSPQLPKAAAPAAVKTEPVKPEAPTPPPAKPVQTAAPKPATEPFVVPSLASTTAISAANAAEPSQPKAPVAARAAVQQNAAASTDNQPAATTSSPAATASPAAATGSSAVTPLPPPPPRSDSGFLMPVAGKVIAGFGPQPGGLHNDGINIAAAKGTAVKAADNGIVVYAGNELRGFGNMLLVQHTGGYMTAYAHLDSMAVQRGQRITRGQKIGAVGMTGNVTKPQLHFEIRLGKQPVDPEKQMAASNPRTAMIGQLR